jgi:PhnB protein
VPDTRRSEVEVSGSDSDSPGQRIVPMIGYEDAAGAIDFLCRAFGFVEDEESRYTDGERVTHAELGIGDGARIMLANPSPEYVSPKRLREQSDAAARMYDNPWVIDGHFVVVDDVEAHCERARAAGAAIIREPDDPGVGFRVYTAEDPEGHRWMFGQRQR